MQPKTAHEYLSEFDKKYNAGTEIADTPGNREKLGDATIGKPLEGEKILEVPRQNTPVPQEILEEAERRNITIRDEDGYVYEAPG